MWYADVIYNMWTTHHIEKQSIYLNCVSIVDLWHEKQSLGDCFLGTSAELVSQVNVIFVFKIGKQSQQWKNVKYSKQTFFFIGGRWKTLYTEKQKLYSIVLMSLDLFSWAFVSKVNIIPYCIAFISELQPCHTEIKSKGPFYWLWLTQVFFILCGEGPLLTPLFFSWTGHQRV